MDEIFNKQHPHCRCEDRYREGCSAQLYPQRAYPPKPAALCISGCVLRRVQNLHGGLLKELRKPPRQKRFPGRKGRAKLAGLRGFGAIALNGYGVKVLA